MTLLPWIGPLACLMLGLGLGAAAVHGVWQRRHRKAIQALQEAAERQQQQLQAQLGQVNQCREEGESRFRAFIAALPDATIRLDGNGGVIEANPSAQRLLHWDGSAVARPVAEVLRITDPAQALTWNERLRRTVQDPFADNGCLALSTVDAQGRALTLELWPWRTQLRGQDTLILLCRDLSATALAQRSLAALREQLQQERIAHEKSLALQQARAQTAVRAKDEFLANMSHELRTPLHVVLGQAHLASQGATGAQARQMARLSEAAQQLLGLLNDVLEFAQHDSDQPSPPAQDTELSHLLWQLGQGWRNLAGQKGLELVTWLDAAVPAVVRLDEWRIRRVLNNLLSNAVKFTAQGHITLRVSQAMAPNGQALLRFEVSDTGVGIPADVLKRLGEPFEQVDGSTTRAAGGAGLGLAICRRLLDRIGSSLGAASQPGRGARFWFDLPLASGAMAAPVPTHAVEPVLQRRALVVDDLDDARAALAAHLSRLGYTVQTAASAAEAQLAVGHAESVDRSFDLCLIDGSLAEMPVSELAHRIRAAARRRPPQLVLMTHAASEASPQDPSGPFGAICHQPSTPGTLAEALDSLPKAHDDTAAPAPGPSGDHHSLAGPWTQVIGLDPQVGMRIVRGDADKFERLLRRFWQSHRDDPDHLRAHAARGQIRQAIERAHTLKGTAGAIGAHAVSEAAARVCRIHAEQASVVDRAPVVLLAGALSDLLGSLRSVLGEEPVGNTNRSDDSVGAGAAHRDALQDQLRERLAQRDMSALRFAREHDAQIRSLLGAAAPPLLQAIQAFDYDQALALLGGEMPPGADRAPQVAAQP